MDLSWCIICDRHCLEDNLYCSDECRVKDVQTPYHPSTFPATPLSPPSSPQLSYARHMKPMSSSSFYNATTFLPSPPSLSFTNFLDT
ncbi:hypothetical protein BX666DRAFT_1894804 [Dichotomocladium elegans]|nr:hypothetical protein BX666DRAFT_1894804 [Dichotomocladium elegans]